LAGLFPVVTFDACDVAVANELLVAWGHKMGPIKRPQFVPDRAHVLYFGEQPVALTVMSQLITPRLGVGMEYMVRENTIELSRLCACRPGLCRVALRLWREFVFEPSTYEFAVSYQDADLHSGNTYRFDGWREVGYSPRGGPDKRTGRRGRNKKIWQWPPPDPKAESSDDRKSLSTVQGG
jgi:hypothetical protein